MDNNQALLASEQRRTKMKKAATKGRPSDLEAMQERGRGLTEYGLLLGVVIFCFVVFIKTFNLEQAVADIFSRVDNAILQLIKSNGVDHREQ